MGGVVTAARRAIINVNTGNVAGVIGARQHLLCAFASLGFQDCGSA
jgi:hypothetical protein